MQATSDLNRKLKVFLCHASDDKEMARKLYHQLEADGVDPWLDEINILPGQEWQYEIPLAARDADAVLVCLSNSSIDKDGYIQQEIQLVLDVVYGQPDNQIYLIPLKLEDCHRPDSLRRWKWVGLFEEDGYERLLESLRYRASILGLQSDIGAGGDSTFVTKSRPKRKIPWVVIGGIIAAVAGIAGILNDGFGVWDRIRPRETASPTEIVVVVDDATNTPLPAKSIPIQPTVTKAPPTETKTVTPNPVVTAPPLPLPRLTITGSLVNLRTGPGENYAIIGTARQGQQFSVLAKSPDSEWWQISWDSQGVWVSGQFTKADNIGGVEVAQSILPTPIPITIPTLTSTPTPAYIPLAPTSTPTPTPAPILPVPAVNCIVDLSPTVKLQVNPQYDIYEDLYDDRRAGNDIRTDTNIFLFLEQKNIRISSALEADMVGAIEGFERCTRDMQDCQPNSLMRGEVELGSKVDSYFVHFYPTTDDLQSVNARIRFHTKIRAIFLQHQSITDSDRLIFNDREREFRNGLESVGDTPDKFTISGDGQEIVLNLTTQSGSNNVGMDQLRIFVDACP